MDETGAGSILFVSARWQTRALLAAELGERVQRDVVSATDAAAALRLIKLAGVDPAVMVVDAGQGLGADDVDRLLEAKRDVPLVLIGSGLRQGALDDLRQRCAAYLERPVSIGAVAQAVVDVVRGRGASLERGTAL